LGQLPQVKLHGSSRWKKSALCGFVGEESVFSQALQNFECMSLMAANTTKTISNVSPAIAETYQIFEKAATGVDRR